MAASGVTPLTEREQQVLELLAEGHSNRAIGKKLWLGENTVKTHCKTLSRKLGAGNRTHAVHLAHLAGLLRAAIAEDKHRRRNDGKR